MAQTRADTHVHPHTKTAKLTFTTMLVHARCYTIALHILIHAIL